MAEQKGTTFIDSKGIHQKSDNILLPMLLDISQFLFQSFVDMFCKDTFRCIRIISSKQIITRINLQGNFQIIWMFFGISHAVATATALGL